MKAELIKIWEQQFQGDEFCRTEDFRRYEVSKKAVDSLIEKGMIEEKDDEYVPTTLGRSQFKVVMAGGVFDILHPGHVYFLEKAKELGDVLLVVVARDSTAQMRKKKPIIPQIQRVEMVRSLKPVDLAILGREGNYLDVVEDIRPDIIAIGLNQEHDEKEIEKKLKARGMDIKVMRMGIFKECPLQSSREIIKRIVDINIPFVEKE